MNRRERLAARRRGPVSAVSEQAERFREAHRVLRIERGAEAALYTRSAASAALVPAAEFASPADWRDFLEGLYPAWAVDRAVALYGATYADEPATVILEPNRVPHIRYRPRSALLSVAYYTPSHVGEHGLWRIPAPDPLTDADEPGYDAREARRWASAADV